MTVIVREREIGDLGDCVAAVAAVHASDGYPDTWPDNPETWLTPPTLRAAWVALQGDSVIGHVLVKTGVDVELEVSRLFVVPTARGSGAGEKLLAAATGHAVEQGCAVALDVTEESVAAIALYERLGWKLVCGRPADWIMQDGSRPFERRYVYFESNRNWSKFNQNS